MKPFDDELNQVLLTISQHLLPDGFLVTDNAPSTFKALCCENGVVKATMSC